MAKPNDPEAQATQASQEDVLAEIRAQQEAALAELKAQQEAALAALQAQLASVTQQLTDHEQRLSEPEAKELVEQMAPTPKLDETVKGGRYRVGQTLENPNGYLVNANGEPIKE